MAHFETPGPSRADAVDAPTQRVQTHSDRSDGPTESPFMHELRTNLNGPVPDTTSPGEKPGPVAYTVAETVRDAQLAVGRGNWDERDTKNDQLNAILKAIKNPEEMQKILAQADQLLAKDNLKLVRNSDGSVWEGRREQETSPYYPVVELYEPKPAAGP